MNRLLVRAAGALLLLIAPYVLQAQPVRLIESTVSSVDAGAVTFTVAAGRITIDASSAVFSAPGDEPATFASLIPGARVSVLVAGGVRVPGVPLRAERVSILERHDTLLSGPIDAIDLANSTITVLDVTLHVDERTTIGGEVAGNDPRTLAELVTGEAVAITLDRNAAAPAASQIRVIAPKPEQTLVFRAALVAINGNAWLLAENRFANVVHVTGATSIDGDPQPGDVLELTVRVDGETATALRIAVTELTAPPPEPTFVVAGVLEARTRNTITVHNALVPVLIRTTPQSTFTGDPQIGDNVIVAVQRYGDDLIALRIEKRSGPITLVVLAEVTAMNGNDWQIGEHRFIVNDATIIDGQVRVGDRVMAIGDRQPDGTFIARRIVKQ